MKLYDIRDRTDPATSIDEVYRRIDALFDAGWRENVEALAECMAALRAEHRALRSLIARHTAAATDPRLQGAQSFILRYTERYGLRINLWFPDNALARSNERYRKYLSIDELHNHDFSFLTICLSGPGYISDFYMDKDFSPERSTGDTVDLISLGEIQLNGETVMFVERDLDYHSQQWPAAFTTTLNLIPREPHPCPVQYVVAKHDHRIQQVIHGEASLAA